MKVFITGGSGFLGRALMNYCYEWDCTVYSRDEYKQDLCKVNYPNARYILGDVRDADRMSLAMAGHDLVIHTAAIKYIPEAETNVSECIAVNVEGSRAVLKAARQVGISTVVGISTDKAVQPVNAYGASKMMMERLFDEAARYGQHATLVRYGNVVGSTGSVIPLFKRQLADKGYITLTDPDMTRFWISAADAVDLVRWASVAPFGSITIPKAKAMSMFELAHMLASESAGTVRIVGPRPGEKKHESMIHKYESIRAVDCGDYYTINPVGSCPVHSEFIIDSDQPDQWLDSDTMRSYIKLAEVLP